MTVVIRDALFSQQDTLTVDDEAGHQGLLLLTARDRSGTSVISLDIEGAKKLAAILVPFLRANK